MNIQISKPAVAAIAAALLATASYWYWSPFLAIKSIQSAAQANDAEAFNDHIDYPRLRESLKAQLSALIAKEMQKSQAADNPFAALGSMLGMSMVDTMVDGMVQPETVMQAMKDGQFGPEPSSTPGTTTDGASVEKDVKWSYGRKGTDKLIAYPEYEGAGHDDAKLSVVFERSGFAHWKLTEVRIPFPLSTN